jgi:hypothetical protein
VSCMRGAHGADTFRQRATDSGATPSMRINGPCNDNNNVLASDHVCRVSR